MRDDAGEVEPGTLMAALPRHPQQEQASWRRTVAKYEAPELSRSAWQVVNTVVPYIALWYLMYRSLNVSYWMTVALAVPAAGFASRLFIIFHDCGHGAFFTSKRANTVLGFFTGILTFTPYHSWRHEHAIHHATSGDLDRRGVGDIWTMTVDEYLNSSFRDRLRYRLYRNPLMLFALGPLYLFLVSQRFPHRRASKRERRSVHWTNLVLVGVVAIMSMTIGLKAYIMVQLPILMIVAAAAVWMFYVQHQHEGAYWERHERWDYLTAALEGSSFYKLPRTLQWFTGNIGFHHIHHLSPRIPNYFLQKCHDDSELFTSVRSITLVSSAKALTFRLWDEERHELVGFGRLRASRYRHPPAAPD